MSTTVQSSSLTVRIKVPTRTMVLWWAVNSEYCNHTKFPPKTNHTTCTENTSRHHNANNEKNIATSLKWTALLTEKKTTTDQYMRIQQLLRQQHGVMTSPWHQWPTAYKNSHACGVYISVTRGHVHVHAFLSLCCTLDRNCGIHGGVRCRQ